MEWHKEDISSSPFTTYWQKMNIWICKNCVPAWPLCLLRSRTGVISLITLSASTSTDCIFPELQLVWWSMLPPRDLINNRCLLKTGEEAGSIQFFAQYNKGNWEFMTTCFINMPKQQPLFTNPNMNTLKTQTPQF